MEQSQQMFNTNAGSMPPTVAISTQQIQQCLDENKELILAILKYQCQGKFAECALYQSQLQKNLTFLARIADCQPQAQTVSRMLSRSDLQQVQYMPHSQDTMSLQQPVSGFNDVHKQQQHQPPF